MSRRLNIERRRKRIRHYTARRRRRSPVRRAILFWWGTALLLVLLGGALVQLLALRAFWHPGSGAEMRWRLPQATLSLIYASEADVAEALRMGNTRRSARAMSDADIGISFEMPLPEPQPIALKPLPPLPTTLADSDQKGCALVTLPPMYHGDGESDPPAVIVRTAGTLTAVGYEPKMVLKPEPDTRGTATFAVELDDAGHVVHVLRLTPSGEETPRLKMLRKILTRTRGTAAATGHVTFTWNTKDLP